MTSHFLNRSDNVWISTTSADIATHTFANISVGFAARLGHQAYPRNDLTRCAVTTLESVMIDESLLQGMQDLTFGKTLDCGDLISVMHDSKTETRIYSPAVDENSAGTTLAMVTTFFAACQIEPVSQKVQKCNSRINAE
jgi:hypothetical protein